MQDPAHADTGALSPNADSRRNILAAFAALYIIWGSTYLAIRYAIETIPPFLMAGARFLIAGMILYVWSRGRGSARPTRAQWIAGVISGVLLIAGGNGSLVWAEQRVPSGIAALIVAIVPLWMVLLEWFRPGGRRPRTPVFVGLALGLAGLVLLVGPATFTGGGDVDSAGALVLIVGAFLWALGSIYGRHHDRPNSPLMTTGVQMGAGGVALLLMAVTSGEMRDFNLAGISTASALGFAYLVSFGSLVGFTAYIYLLGATTVAKASTYAYVNPVVAVFLGWVFAGEPITSRTLVAAAVIVAGVAVITAVPPAEVLSQG